MSVDKPNQLTGRPVTTFQKLSTRFRFLLAVPAVAALLYLVDRGTMWPSVVVIAFGEFMQLWASAHLHKNVDMVTSGPYSLLRNPMYLGRGFVGLGFVLMTWRWYLLSAYVLGYACYAQARVVGEEKRLRGLFGEDYARYCAAVNRWLPWPRTKLSEARWSWEAVKRNHQLRVTLGIAAMIAVLWWRVRSPETFGLGR
jgi:protein-S-isoprenylcysteine O-methyltransferase Ste14